MKNAGRVMPLPRGEYDGTVTYNLLDFVTYNGSSYICKKESMGNTPAENSEFWQLMALKGSSGGAVTGVKGSAETAYRQGNVNITKDNIGLNNVANERQYSALNPQPSVAGSSGSCTGNSATATKATQDGNGRNIVDTYATKTEVDALKKSVSDGKTLVANAITAKGVTTATDAEFATMATNIGKIQTGVDTSDATAVAANILNGKTAYVKGSKITGAMAEKAGVTVDATATMQDNNYIYLNMPEGHYDTASKVRTPNSNFTPEFELVEGICKPGDVIDLKKQIVAIAIAYNRQSMLVSASFWAVSFGNFYKYPQNTNAIIIDGTKATLTYRGGVAAGGGTGDTDPADYYMALVVK